MAFTSALGRRTTLLRSMHRDAMSHVGVGLSPSLARVEVGAKAHFTVESGACRMKVARRARKAAV
jgi:hypothetical protein